MTFDEKIGPTHRVQMPKEDFEISYFGANLKSRLFYGVLTTENCLLLACRVCLLRRIQGLIILTMKYNKLRMVRVKAAMLIATIHLAAFTSNHTPHTTFSNLFGFGAPLPHIFNRGILDICDF